MEAVTLLAIGLTLLVSFLLSEITHHFKYPRVLGQILAGVVIGIPVFQSIINAEAVGNIEFLADIAIVFLFLIIGMEININHLKAERRRSLIIGSFSIMAPVVLGYAVGHFLGYEPMTSLVIGICLAVTSETTNSQLFIEMGLIKKRLAKVMFGAAMLADVFAIVFLAFLIPTLQGDLEQLAAVPIKIIAFILIILGLIRFMPRLVTHIEEDESSIAEISLMIIFGLLVAGLSIQMGLGEFIGAFMAGVIIQLSLRHRCSTSCGNEAKAHRHHKAFFMKNIEALRVMTLSFIVPFFFINMGLKLELNSIIENPKIVGLILLAAVAGKLLGAVLAKPWAGLNWTQTHLAAWGMNSRGTIELVIAELTLMAGVITTEIYGALVLMVMLTTITFPLVLKRIIRRHPDVMDLN